MQSIIRNLENILNGQPWFGRAVYPIMEEVEESKIHIHPGDDQHSLAELLFHMITWSTFCLKHMEKAPDQEILNVETEDWRTIDQKIHTWKKGLDQFKSINQKIIAILETKDDSFLKEIVPGREFNFRFMLNGLIQHHIYHLGQVAYVNKLLQKNTPKVV